MSTLLRVTCAVPAFNAGDTTPGIESVGVGMQWEQSANIDRVVQRGATIQQALQQLIISPSYRVAARQLKAELDGISGRQVTGDLIWDPVNARV